MCALAIFPRSVSSSGTRYRARREYRHSRLGPQHLEGGFKIQGPGTFKGAATACKFAPSVIADAAASAAQGWGLGADLAASG